ncbi:hypothetical protein B0T26DRAFT_753562 [Lasiosphaeria miniovina]|uniref:Uncharacterized protein n=1 Tax=Lasiosphaeria miniovina TaxID=1954250 RepID=A0AA40ACS3_9PEZI|nr:uncharacterized protein B0T26DRAFT_753562 [Lasiosphaeria miniovina]KAK0713460.1 hypothetical protein B0T26DRAFT_753562 [Lasiosphaeria miniovina]
MDVVVELVDNCQSIYVASSRVIGCSIYPSEVIGNMLVSRRLKIYGPVFKAVARVMSVVFVLAVVGLEDFLFTRLLELFPASWAWTLENILDSERLCDETLLYIYTSLFDKLGNFTVLFTIIQHVYLFVAIQTFFWCSHNLWHDSMAAFIWLD